MGKELEGEKVSHFDFCFLHSLDHVTIIVGQVEEASAFTGRGELPKRVVPANRYHVVCCIYIEQLPQSPEFIS